MMRSWNVWWMKLPDNKQIRIALEAFGMKVLWVLLLFIAFSGKAEVPALTTSLVPDTIPLVTKDSVEVKKVNKHSPGKALWMSAVLPGLGQAYNKKYWKIPVIWAGFGGLGYGIYHTASRFVQYRNAYRLQVDQDPSTIGEVKGIQDPATLKFYRDQNKRNLDIVSICTAVWYALNLIDAAVDAHLFHYDISDDLTLQWQPVVIDGKYPGGGLALHLR